MTSSLLYIFCIALFLLHILSTMDDYDSGEDLFITQSSFHTATTQDADEAANFFDTSFIIEDDLMAKGDVVEYWDFSHEIVNVNSEECATKSVDAVKSIEDNQGKEAATTSEIAVNASIHVNPNIAVGEEPFIPLVADLLDDADVDKVQDELLQAAAEALTSEKPNSDRHGAPVSDAAVQQHTGKGYVFIHIFKLLQPLRVWSLIVCQEVTYILQKKKLVLQQADFTLHLILYVF